MIRSAARAAVCGAAGAAAPRASPTGRAAAGAAASSSRSAAPAAAAAGRRSAAAAAAVAASSSSSSSLASTMMAARRGVSSSSASSTTAAASSSSSAAASPRVAASASGANGSGGVLRYTLTDEAPALATAALLPVVRRFAGAAGVTVEEADLSLAGRLAAAFPDAAPSGAAAPSDDLAALGEAALRPDAVIIKLPNISASAPQLSAAVAELRSQGWSLPATDDAAAQKQYAGVLGSAVNPVLRQGNSDRRAAPPVKAFAQAHPVRLGAWKGDERTHVAGMTERDFFATEQARTFDKETTLSVSLRSADGGDEETLRSGLKVQSGEIVDSSVMGAEELCAFFEREMNDAKEKDLLLSLHLKATMMKVSDPIMFGHAVRTYYKHAFAKNADLFQRLGVDANKGLGDVYDKIKDLPAAEKEAVEKDIQDCYAQRPRIAMVNSDNGITNLHVPSDVIIDASMPVVVRDSGKMWNKDGELEDTKCLIPDRCYGPVFQAVFDFCREEGAFDPSTMGHTSNVGLMAQKAQEYGSHPNTIEVPRAGTIVIKDEATGEVVMEHGVKTGDIFRMCQVKDAPIQDWVQLAVRRARESNTPAIFWLDAERAHDAELLRKVEPALAALDTSGLDISIMKPADACTATCRRAKEGLDTISVSGNVLRDYLTDLFPILELGTSAKMLSIVPLLAGGGLFETGAGGSAPKHVQQFVEEGHLRWDSLGEYLALAVSLEDLGAKTGNEKATALGKALFDATGKVLDEGKSPSRKTGELDTRGTHYFIARWWAEAMATTHGDASFAPLAEALAAKEDVILQELLDAQGKPVDIGGYYRPDAAKVESAMRPSATYNDILSSL